MLGIKPAAEVKVSAKVLSRGGRAGPDIQTVERAGWRKGEELRHYQSPFFFPLAAGCSFPRTLPHMQNTKYLQPRLKIVVLASANFHFCLSQRSYMFKCERLVCRGRDFMNLVSHYIPIPTHSPGLLWAGGAQNLILSLLSPSCRCNQFVAG